MQSNNSAETPAIDLCHSCRAFYGSRERGFLCSSCYKDQKVAISPEVKPEVKQLVEQTLSVDKEVLEESKESKESVNLPEN